MRSHRGKPGERGKEKITRGVGMKTEPLTEAARLKASSVKPRTEWRSGGIDRVAQLMPGCSFEELEGFQICLHCGWLFEVGEEEPIQRCRCLPRGEKWEGYDFNMKIDLCQCCAWEVVYTGLRWTWLCGWRCRSYARALNNLVGICIIPAGRHSIMNGVAYSGKVLEIPEGIRAAADGLNNIISGWKRLSEWSEKEVQRKLRSIGARRGKARSIWLIDYIIEVADRVPSGTGQADEIAKDAFRRYLDSCGIARKLADFAIEWAELHEGGSTVSGFRERL